MQAPVQMVFACSLAGGDILYVIYRVPTISLSRAEQREKAAETLGLPGAAHRIVHPMANRVPHPSAAHAANGVVRAQHAQHPKRARGQQGQALLRSDSREGEGGGGLRTAASVWSCLHRNSLTWQHGMRHEQATLPRERGVAVEERESSRGDGDAAPAGGAAHAEAGDDYGGAPCSRSRWEDLPGLGSLDFTSLEWLLRSEDPLPLVASPWGMSAPTAT